MLSDIENLLSSWYKGTPSGAIESVYLSGSSIDGTSVENSDVDIIIVATIGQNDLLAASIADLGKKFERTLDKEAGVLFLEKQRTKGPIPRYLKEAKLVVGHDYFSSLDEMAPWQIYDRWTKGSVRLLDLVLNRWSSFHDIFAESSKNLSRSHEAKRGEIDTKPIINLVARIIGARLALEASYVPCSKSDCFRQFKMIANAQEHDFSEHLLQSLKFDWNYRVPTRLEDRLAFQELLSELIRFVRESFEHIVETQEHSAFVHEVNQDELTLILRGSLEELALKFPN